MKELTKKLIILIGIFFIISNIIFFPFTLMIYLFPFQVQGNMDNQCFVYQSSQLTNATRDPIYDIFGWKCCTVSNQRYYPDFVFYCAED